MRKPAIIFVNRYGMAFGHSRNPTTYERSGRNWRTYYRHVCLRCGGNFAGNRHKAHTTELCDMMIAMRGDPEMDRYCRTNLYGRP